MPARATCSTSLWRLSTGKLRLSRTKILTAERTQVPALAAIRLVAPVAFLPLRVCAGLRLAAPVASPVCTLRHVREQQESSICCCGSVLPLSQFQGILPSSRVLESTSVLCAVLPAVPLTTTLRSCCNWVDW